MLYLLHQRRDGVPVGVFNETHDYYNPADYDMRDEGRATIFLRLPSTPWSEFIEILASKTPGPTSQWDTFDSSSSSLEAVLAEAKSQTGYRDEKGAPVEV